MPTKDRFQIRYGKSVLAEFVRSHDYNSLIDELIQNDYDAGSPETIIHFLEDRLVCTGFGKPVDEDGWKRLELVMGTDEDAPSKHGLLGVKNQGLRSLFLLGDYIYVKSNGYITILSMEYGALKEKLIDCSTKGSSGTVIEVPYRTEENDELPVFTLDKEKELIQELQKSLPLKIVMLSTFERLHVMSKITVLSLRTNTFLSSRQNVKSERLTETVTAIRRSLSLEIGRL
jgi:hypothetical protein